jgi:hypothetical protein
MKFSKNIKEKISSFSDDDKRVKGSNRIQMNNNLTAVSLVIVSILLTTDKISVGAVALSQLAIAIPCLATSSLAYAKLCFRDVGEYKLWNWLGWFTHSVGYLAILNSFTLMLAKSNHESIAWLFLGVIIFLHILYFVLNVIGKVTRWKLSGLKLFFYASILFFGAALPMIKGW